VNTFLSLDASIHAADARATDFARSGTLERPSRCLL